MLTDGIIPESRARRQVSLLDLLLTFLRLGTLSFGGSLQAWVHREVVDRKGWIGDREFLSGMTVARILPGANPVNLALYVGLQLRGGVGAVVAVLGMVIPAFCVILLLGFLYRTYGQLMTLHFVLGGLAAAGVGATLTMGIRLARRLPGEITSPLIAAAVFVAVGLLRLPMVPTVLIAMPLSIAWAFVSWKGSRALIDKRLIELVLVFVPLSLLSFGGGQAIVPEIQNQSVAVHGWLTDQQFADIFAIARAAPGPNTLIVALIGYQVYGFLGALVATLAIFVPSSVIVYAAANWWQRNEHSIVRRAIERGLAPIAVGLIFASVLIVLRSAHAGVLELTTTAIVCGVYYFTKTNTTVMAALIAVIYLGLYALFPQLAA